MRKISGTSQDQTDQEDQIWQILWIDCPTLFLNAFLNTHTRAATCVSQTAVQWLLDTVLGAALTDIGPVTKKLHTQLGFWLIER